MDDQVFKCGKCDAQFYSRDDLRAHIFQVHLYPNANFSALDKEEDDTETRRSKIETLQGQILKDFQGQVPEGSESHQVAGEIMADNKGYTHEILRNPEGHCVIVERTQPRPPHWKIYHTGSKAACESYFHTKCGAGAGGNTCT